MGTGRRLNLFWAYIFALLSAIHVYANQEIEKIVKEAKKKIQTYRKLKFKRPLKFKKIKRKKGYPKDIRGYYSKKDKTFYIFEDVEQKYETGLIIHEMVHALQDQIFDISRTHIHKIPEDDYAVAFDALVEGDAVFTMVECIKDKNPKVVKMLEVSWYKPEQAISEKRIRKILTKTFLYSKGAGFVQFLKDKGGWDLVNKIYHYLPLTTRHILHPEQLLNGFRKKEIPFCPHIVFSKKWKIRKVFSKGEFGTLVYFARFPELSSDAEGIASGLNNDCFIKLKEGKKRATVWLSLWDTEKDAKEFFTAVNRIHKDKKIFLMQKGARAWRDNQFFVVVVKNNDLCVYIKTNEVGVIEKVFDSLDKGILESVKIYSPSEQKMLSLREFQKRLLKADVICVGEEHTNTLHHKIQEAIIKMVFEKEKNMAVGMEMFENQRQEVIDSYLAGRINEVDFLIKSNYMKKWGFDYPRFYRGIVEFCKKNGVQITGLNAPRELVSKVAKKGWKNLSKKQKQILGKIDFKDRKHRRHWFGKLGRLHGKKLTRLQERRIYQAMCVWDNYMAKKAVETLKNVNRIVVIAGQGHTDYKVGIPNFAKKLGAKNVVVIHIGDKRYKSDIADFIIIPNWR
jgi:uncharacterized iron-regulated protein